MKFPVLQSFEKDLNKIVFVINQLSRGLDDLVVTIAGMRQPLTADRTFHVAPAPTGSDVTGTGDATAPFASVQAALDFIIQTIDLTRFNAIIKMADGTYTTSVRILESPAGGGNIIIRGNTTTPSNVVWDVAGNTCVYVESITAVQVEYMRLKTTGGGHCLHASGTGKITLGSGLDFNACAGFHIFADLGGVIIMHDPNSYTISGGGGLGHYGCSNGHIKVAGINPITISVAAITFSQGFASADVLGSMTLNLNVYGGPGAGAATICPKFMVRTNAIINTFGAGLGYLPGSIAGTTGSGGQYI